MADVSASGVIHVDGFDFLLSYFASEEARKAYLAEIAGNARGDKEKAESSSRPLTIAEIEKSRKQADEQIVLPLLKKQEARWPDTLAIEPKIIGAVFL